MPQAEIVARRRKWNPEEKAALLAEIEAEGGRVSVVARRHGISDSLLYNWRAAWKAAASTQAPKAVEFVPLGMVGPPGEHRRDGAGLIEIELPNGIRVRVDSFVNEKALSRILRAVRESV
jgi:transposase